MEDRIQEFNALRLDAFFKIRQVLTDSQNEIYQRTIKDLPKEKQEEFEEIKLNIFNFILNEFKKHDLCPAYIVLGGTTFGGIYIESKLKAKSLEKCQQSNNKSNENYN